MNDMSDDLIFLVDSRWIRMARAGPDQRRQLWYETGRHGWSRQFREAVYRGLTRDVAGADAEREAWRRKDGDERHEA